MGDAIQFDPARNDYLRDGREFARLDAEVPEADPRWRDIARLMNVVIKSLRWRILNTPAQKQDDDALEQITPAYKAGYGEGFSAGAYYRHGDASGQDYYDLRDKYK